MDENKLEKLKKDLNKTTSTSLASKMTDLKTKIATMQQFKDKSFLCDVSGSMSSFVDFNGDHVAKSAKDVVQETIDHFKGAKIFEFSDRMYFKKDGKLSQPNGGTNLGGAFRDLKDINVKEIILLTDGQPDSPQHALEQARGMKIDIIYIGPQPTPQFLIDLANATGGKFADVELIKLGSQAQEVLENKIKGFLSA